MIGRDRFGVYCAPCHGMTGAGDGPVVRRGFPAPPALASPPVASASGGALYGVLSSGYGVMAGYGGVLTPRDRWAVVGYIRALQIAGELP